jgi:hypothetical protein
MSTSPGLSQGPPAPDILLDMLLGNVLDPLLMLPILRSEVELQV